MDSRTLCQGTRRVPLTLYINTVSTILEEAAQRDIEVIILQPANRHRLDIVDVEVTWDPYFKAQTAVAEHYNIPTIDVAPILRAFGLSKSQAFLDQMHPTAEANYWIAQSILALWKDRVNENQNWLPTNTPHLHWKYDRWTSE